MVKVKLNGASKGLDLWVARQEDMVKAEYQRLIWKIFLRLLRNTPQYTGHAAASWNIGVGTPNRIPSPYNSDVEDPESYSPLERAKARVQGGVSLPAYEQPENIRQRGDRRAIEHAKRRNAPKIALIERRSKVFFTNTAQGDMTAKADAGQSTTFYLEALQDKGYWAAKLRDVNKPYETANETLNAVNEGLLRKGQAFRAGGATFDSWENYL